jgi:hypothetical protein
MGSKTQNGNFLENGSTDFDISAFIKTLFLNKIAYENNTCIGGPYVMSICSKVALAVRWTLLLWSTAVYKERIHFLFKVKQSKPLYMRKYMQYLCTDLFVLGIATS